MRKKIDFHFASLEAPIAINGSINKIIWEVDNVLFVKIFFKGKRKVITKNYVDFYNSTENKVIEIHFYGIDQVIKKNFNLYLLQYEKSPLPNLQLKKESLLSTKVNPKLSFSKSILNFNFIITPYKIKSTFIDSNCQEKKVMLNQINLEELDKRLSKINEEQDINILTKTIENEKQLLSQSKTRPYHEIAMESRWF